MTQQQIAKVILMDNNPTPSSEEESAENAALNDIEARVLGCLMEKQQTTPDQYPLTLNSLMLACNQKSSREPQMSLTEGEVGHCLRELENRQLIRVDMGARASRYEHRMTMAFHVDKPLQAVLTVMMLRGPQTANELYTRTQRAYTFSNIEEVQTALERLIERPIPLVKLMGRQAGQREDRYAHLLCGEPSMPDYERSAPARSTQSERLDALEQRVAALEAQLSDLLN